MREANLGVQSRAQGAALAFRSCQLVDDGKPLTMQRWLLMRAGLRGGGPYLRATGKHATHATSRLF